MTFPDFLYFYLRTLNIEITLIFILCLLPSGAPFSAILRRFRLREKASYKIREYAPPGMRHGCSMNNNVEIAAFKAWRCRPHRQAAPGR